MNNGLFVLAPENDTWVVEVYDGQGKKLGEVTCETLEDALDGIQEAVEESPLDVDFEEN